MKFFKTVILSVKSFLDDEPMTYAASLAFYTVVSLPAILILAVNVAGTAYENEEVRETLLTQLSKYLGPSTVNQAERILENANVDVAGVLPQIVAWTILIISATTVFIALQDGINHIWKVRAKGTTNYMKLLIDRVLSFAMIVSIGFVLLVSLIIDSLIVSFQDWIIRHYSNAEFILITGVDIIISLLVIATIFAFIFKVLPDVKTKWKNVWLGAIFTAVLFMIGKVLISLYLSTSDVGGVYGASGSLVVFLFWVYYSSIIVLFGAKFTYVYTIQEEDNIRSEQHATFIQEVENPNSTIIANEEKL